MDGCGALTVVYSLALSPESCGFLTSGGSGRLEKGSVRRAWKASPAGRTRPTVAGAGGCAVWPRVIHSVVVVIVVVEELSIFEQPLLIRQLLEDALDDVLQLEHRCSTSWHLWRPWSCDAGW